jgi:predicted DNA-binding transcriptional regulator YafY
VPGALREMGLEDAASAARLKVSAALLPSLRDASRTAAQRFHLDAPNWFREPQTPELLPAVADAVWDDRRITARYRRGAGESRHEVERELEPYGLVLKAGVWYLCARVAGRDSFRVYRIDRFTAVEPREERFERAEDFELPAFWEERAEQFARSLLRAEVVLRLTAEGMRRLPHVVDAVSAREALEGVAEPGAGEWVAVTLPVESEEVARTQLSGLGAEVEVVEPVSLREFFAAEAERLVRLYRRG